VKSGYWKKKGFKKTTDRRDLFLEMHSGIEFTRPYTKFNAVDYWAGTGHVAETVKIMMIYEIRYSPIENKWIQDKQQLVRSDQKNEKHRSPTKLLDYRPIGTRDPDSSKRDFLTDVVLRPKKVTYWSKFVTRRRQRNFISCASSSNGYKPKETRLVPPAVRLSHCPHISSSIVSQGADTYSRSTSASVTRRTNRSGCQCVNQPKVNLSGWQSLAELSGSPLQDERFSA
jgi:hypothetical protein